MSYSRVKNKPGNYFKNILYRGARRDTAKSSGTPDFSERVIEHCSQC